ncbi:MAG: wax ester/triacylglycerol synthase family O-acyltransferase [Deltaproteobacteria bacterium]|jgi:WS/DGAT/MGAT family acyltransferase|nr:wax ester/triacylglycerol synthase family O-acyltransferase [Deltaproteobacteria bacterium]MBW2496170.1 wax ester/triacylglycerol synthase family O-acyltransferase [Deltaproteobacteria bacterium]
MSEPDRLGLTDSTFLYVENETNHMHIASVALFEGPAPHDGEIEEMVSSKLHLVPRYRQIVRFVPYDIARPEWCDDPHFNLRYHVRHTALPSPGTVEQLQTLVGRVMSQQLDRAKPLWEMWIVEGLEDDRWAILSKTHHCMVDGVSATDLMSTLMDTNPDAEHPAPKRWTAKPPPSSFDLTRRAIRDNFSTTTEAWRSIGRAFRAPGRFLDELGDFREGLTTFGRTKDEEPESSLNGPISPHRRWCWAETPLADIKKIRSAHGGTINDVVLAVITRGFHDLLRQRGEPVKDRFVRTLVPVSIRKEEERGTYNNRVSAMFAELPVGIVDPVERLTTLREQMEDLKEHRQAVAAETLASLSGFAPPSLLALGARAFASSVQHAVQTVTTNVPGPQHLLYAAGRPMVAAYPYVPLAGSIQIGVAIFSYAGNLGFGITGDYEAAPDIEVLARGIESGVEELLATV